MDENNILNSEIIIKNIDCSIPCNSFLYFCTSCPSKVINYFPPSKSDIIEILIISSSLVPYLIVLILLCLAIYIRTSRSFLLLLLIIIEDTLVNFLKIIIQQPRPNYLCTKEYGFPSGHTSFCTCILFWFILEEFYIPKPLQFKYKNILIIFGIIYPFILYSRYYLNYHNIEQIVGGFIFGVFIAVSWFFFCIKYILVKDNIIKTIMIGLNIENNMTLDVLYQSDGFILLDIYRKLIKKENELKDMKNKLEKMKKNLGVMDNIREYDEKFKNIMKGNNEKYNEEKYENNNNE